VQRRKLAQKPAQEPARKPQPQPLQAQAQAQARQGTAVQLLGWPAERRKRPPPD